MIRPYYAKYLKSYGSGGGHKCAGGCSFRLYPLSRIAGDLFKITRSGEYELAVRKNFGHPNEQVRWWAEHSMDVQGPTTLKRNEEYAKKHNQKNDRDAS